MADPFGDSHLKTPWSVILSAQGADPETRRACLEYLIGLYREPARRFIQSYLVNGGFPGHDDDADDLTQAFFTHFLEKGILDILDQEKGAFRAFLRKSLANFVKSATRERKRHAPTGVLTRLGEPRDDATADDAPLPASQQRDPDMHSPEEIFDRACAKRLINDAVAAFRQQCLDRRQSHYFTVFERHLWQPEQFGNPSYRESAEALGRTEKDVTNHLHRAKRAFHKLLLERVRQTVATDEAADAELDELRRIYL